MLRFHVLTPVRTLAGSGLTVTALGQAETMKSGTQTYAAHPALLCFALTPGTRRDLGVPSRASCAKRRAQQDE